MTSFIMPQHRDLTANRNWLDLVTRLYTLSDSPVSPTTTIITRACNRIVVCCIVGHDERFCRVVTNITPYVPTKGAG